MSSSTPNPKPKFLLDENVRIDLYKFLQSNDFDVKVAPKGASVTPSTSPYVANFGIAPLAGPTPTPTPTPTIPPPPTPTY